MEEKFYVTEEGLNDLKQELETLIHVKRNEVIADLQDARAQGDLSENADYDAARDNQAKIEARIKELENQIKNAEIITEKRRSNFVRVGSIVEIQELDTKAKLTYKIVGSIEADPLNGKLSNASLVGQHLLGSKAGDVLEFAVPDGMARYEILEVRK